MGLFCTLKLLSYLLESKDSVDGEGFPLVLGEGANNLDGGTLAQFLKYAGLKQRMEKGGILKGTSWPSLNCAACSY